jgi:hypothetical protein
MKSLSSLHGTAPARDWQRMHSNNWEGFLRSMPTGEVAHRSTGRNLRHQRYPDFMVERPVGHQSGITRVIREIKSSWTTPLSIMPRRKLAALLGMSMTLVYHGTYLLISNVGQVARYMDDYRITAASTVASQHTRIHPATFDMPKVTRSA